MPSFPHSELQPARACIGPACHSQPDNHDAICSDPAERLAHTSQGMDDSGYRAPGNHSNVFPVNLDLPDASHRWAGDNGAEPAAITESARATSRVARLSSVLSPPSIPRPESSGNRRWLTDLMPSAALGGPTLPRPSHADGIGDRLRPHGCLGWQDAEAALLPRRPQHRGSTHVTRTWRR